MSSNVKVSDLSALMRDSDSEFTSILPGALFDGDSMFWMYADDRPYFQEIDISTLCTAFGDLRPILWSVALARGSSERLQDYHRGFGFKASDLAYVQKMDIIRQDRPTKIYSDVLWLTQELYPLVADRLSINSSGLSLILSFIPNDSDLSNAWATATIGLFWQNMISSERTIQQQHRKELAHRNIVEYVQMTIEMGGVALILATDIDTKPSILGLGSKISIQHALEQFSKDFEVIPESEGHRQFLRRIVGLKGTF